MAMDLACKNHISYPSYFIVLMAMSMDLACKKHSSYPSYFIVLSYFLWTVVSNCFYENCGVKNLGDKLVWWSHNLPGWGCWIFCWQLIIAGSWTCLWYVTLLSVSVLEKYFAPSYECRPNLEISTTIPIFSLLILLRDVCNTVQNSNSL